MAKSNRREVAREYERAIAQGDRRASVMRDLARLQGVSRSDMLRDQDRGPSSPLGQALRKSKR